MYKYSYILLLCVLSSFCYADVPFSFTDSLHQLTSVELIDKVTTNIPNIEPMITFVDSLDNLGLNHPIYYGIGIDYNIKLDIIGTWDSLSIGNRIYV